MENVVFSKVLARLPNLVTLLFSLTLVTGFRLLNDRFHWNTAPSFELTNPNDVLVLASFVVTLFFVITAWLGFSVLIERVPYQHSFNRFLFDAARISALFPVLMWSFLADQPAHYHVYALGLSSWHLLMTAWYVWPLLTGNRSRTGHGADVGTHALISGVYAGLGMAHYLLVARPWQAGAPSGLHQALVVATLGVVATWSYRRLHSLQRRAHEPEANAATA